MNIISNALFDCEKALGKASYTAESLSEELSFLKAIKKQDGENEKRFIVGMSIILDYLGEVRDGLEVIKEAIKETESQGKKEG